MFYCSHFYFSWLELKTNQASRLANQHMQWTKCVLSCILIIWLLAFDALKFWIFRVGEMAESVEGARLLSE